MCQGTEPLVNSDTPLKVLDLCWDFDLKRRLFNGEHMSHHQPKAPSEPQISLSPYFDASHLECVHLPSPLGLCLLIWSKYSIRWIKMHSHDRKAHVMVYALNMDALLKRPASAYLTTSYLNFDSSKWFHRQWYTMYNLFSMSTFCRVISLVLTLIA